MNLTLNGKLIEYKGDLERSLLSFLRLDQGIITPKDGCSGQGSCGACAVIVDGRSTLSCITPMKRVLGKTVLTTEGLPKETQDIFAKTFVNEGAIQCGFCIPGIVMSGHALLESDKHPAREDVQAALNKHICRCTGYKKIENAILKISKGGDREIKKISGKVGTSLAKFDAEKTVLGLRPFVADIKEPNMLYGALKFSDHPRAKVLKIDIKKAEALNGVVAVVTAKDIPGDKWVGIVIQDWPMMVDVGETTCYIGDVLCQVVAESEAIAREAVKLVDVQYEILKPVLSAEEAMSRGAPVVNPKRKDNILSKSELVNGNPDKAFSESAFVVEGTFYSQRIEHAFLEPECALAFPENGGVKLYSQSQGVYVDRSQLVKITGLPKEKINVVQIQNGGGFGGKEDMTVQGHAVVAAMKVKKPVRVALTREESLMMHPKRHPMRLLYKLGCDKNGKFTAMRARIVGDSGAYASVGEKVLERAAGHATGAYEVPNVDLSAIAAYTNNVPCGAMRGFGVNQTAFAMESCIDMLCERGGFDRFDIRYLNALDEGKCTSTGQKLAKGVGIKRCLDAVKIEFKNAKYAGIACGIKNTGIGNGMPDRGVCKVEVLSPTHVKLSHGWTEMGQGVHTMAIQSLCEVTGIDPTIVTVVNETKEETECGMTTASRGTSLVGNSVIDAANKVKKDLEGKSLKDLVGKTYHGDWVCTFTNDSFHGQRPETPVTHYSYSFAAQVVILDDDGKVKKVIAAHDAGKIMNPTLFEGQIEGSIHMGLGYALSEDCKWIDGRPEHTRYSKLGILKAKETPEIKVIGVESGDEHGPFGAKGVGEIGLVPTAGAVANALCMFEKKRRFRLPLMKEQEPVCPF